MTQDPLVAPSAGKLMRYYLLLLAVVIVPIALNYGLALARSLPAMLNIAVSGTDQTHVFRALMGLYLGAAAFWAIAAFTPSWQRTAVIWGIFFCFSLAAGRLVSLVADGQPSLLLLVYLGLEIAGGMLGLAIVAATRARVR